MGQSGQIVSTPNIRGGRPRIDGHRITVAEVVLAYEGALGSWSTERIAKEFDLTHAEIHTALAYYYAHQEEIDHSIREDELEEAELLKTIPSVREGIARKMAELRARAQKKSA
jgi:uncharacterized protein (DUF433 family)